MEVLKSLKPDNNYLSTAINYSSENLIFYAIMLYSITNDQNVLLFVFGVITNSLIYYILKKKDSNEKTFPSIGMQTISFLYAYIITKKLLDENLVDTNPLFYIIGIIMIYFIWSNSNNSFPALIMGVVVGASVGIIYSWMIYEYNNGSLKNEEIKMFGAPYSDYNTCETIDEENLPKVIEKETTRTSTCV